jgi:hypothetical protein
MIHNLFPNEVYLEPISHRYYDGEGNEYISFSKLYGFLVEKFDANKIAGQYKSMSKEEVLGMWQQATDNGTRIDKALEKYAQTATILDSDQDLKQLLSQVLEKYKVYNNTFEQGIPYSKKYRVAGSWDKLSLVTNRKDSKFHLSDFKCFEKGFDSLFKVSGQAWLHEPFSHLPNNKYSKISMQLSFYAYLFENLTGRKCERLFIDLIIPKWNKQNQLLSFENMTIPVNYLKNDIICFLEHFKSDILNLLSNTVNINHEELF